MPPRSLEDLICSCLETPVPEREVRLEELCTEYPEQADGLRRMYAQLARMGFLVHDDDETSPPLPAAWRLPERFGTYRLERPIGRGGMGVVYRARQTSLDDRVVALKLIRPDLVGDRKAQARFIREALLASRLDHRNVCGVYEVGQDEGIAWVAMPFVEGCTLAERIDEAAASRRERPRALPRLRDGADTDLEAVLAAFVALAHGLAHAHDRGLLHRDVKPGNVVVQPDGTPVLLDFGLARELEAESALTLSGDLVGTPAYMAPEQTARRADLDVRVDVYGLGATLYECLTLELPHPAPTRDEMLRRIRQEPAPDPGKLAPWLPRPVVAVVQGALQADRDRRYDSATAFAEDLQRVLDGRPVVIRRPTLAQRATAWVRRNPWPAAFGAVLTVALAVTAVLATVAGRNADAAIRNGLDARAGDLLGRSLAAQAYDDGEALELAIEAFRTKSTSRTRERLHEAMRAMRLVARVPVGSQDSLALAFDRTGDRMAVVFSRAVAVLGRDGRRRRSVPMPAQTVQAVVAEVGGELVLVLGGADGRIRRWRESAPETVEELGGPEATPRAGYETFHAAALVGDRIAELGSVDGYVYEVDAAAGAVQRWCPEGPRYEIGHLAVLADGTVVATRNLPLGPEDPTLWSQLFGRRDGRLFGPIDVRGPLGNQLGVRSLLPGPRAGQVWLEVRSGVVLFDLDQGKPIKRLTTLYDVCSIAAGPRHVFAGLNNGIIYRWQLLSDGPDPVADIPHPLAWHTGRVDELLAAPETIPGVGPSATLVSARSEDGTIQVGYGNGRRNGPPMRGIHAKVTSLALDPRHELVASATADGLVEIWRRRDPTPSLLEPAGPYFGSFVFAERGEVLIARCPFVAWRGDPETARLRSLGELEECGRFLPWLALRDGRLARADETYLSVHSADTGERLAPAVGGLHMSCGVAFLAPDLVWVADNGGVRHKPRFRFWHLVAGALEERREEELVIGDTWDEMRPFWSFAIPSADGSLFVVACCDGTVRVYGRDGKPVGQPLRRSTGEPAPEVVRLAISPDGRRILSTCQDGTVKSWIRSDGTFGFEREVTRFPTAARWVSFDEKGERIVCSSDAGLLRVFEVGRAEPVEDYHAGVPLYCCRFTPDGSRVCATTADGRFLNWFLDENELLERARALLPEVR